MRTAFLTLMLCATTVPAVVFAQAPIATPDVRLELHDGKAPRYLGDRLQLDLVFRNATTTPMLLNTSLYGDLADEVEVTPTAGWLRWQGTSGHDYSAVAPLTATELRIPLELNQGYVFREPGHYTVRVTTRRASRGAGVLDKDAGPLPPITTNSIDLDLVAMPAEVERARLASLLAEIHSNDGKTQESCEARRNAFAALAALQGDDALRAKIDLMLAEDDDMRTVTWQAMASTRNLPLQLSLLEAAWKDPQRSPIYDMSGALQQTRALLRGQTQPGWQMNVAIRNDEATRLAAGEHAGDMTALYQSLPNRSGQSRTDAIYYLLEDRSLSSAQVARVHEYALQEFPRMSDLEQDIVLGGAWKSLRDPALVPAIEARLDRDPTDQWALPRLIELDPAAARPYVVRAVCNPQGAPALDWVDMLPADTLPEVDACLSTLLRTPPTQGRSAWNWNTRALLAARFATAAILPAARAGWKPSPQDDGMRALLLRYATADALAASQTHPADVSLWFQANKVFQSLHAAFPEVFLSAMRRDLASDQPALVRTAAYELSLGGLATDRTLLEDRLTHIRAQPETTELDYAEVDFISDLRDSPRWQVTDAEVARLSAGCRTDRCRLYGKPRPPEAALKTTP